MSFSESTLQQKFNALNESSASIIGLSQWILFHHRQAERIVLVWKEAIDNSPKPQKLPLVYVANDVIQQSKAKKYTEFIDHFSKVLESTIVKAYHDVNDLKTRQRIARSVNVWKERNVISHKLIERIYEGFKKADSQVPASSVSVSKPSHNNNSNSSNLSHPTLIAVNDQYMKYNNDKVVLSQGLDKFNKEYNSLFGEDAQLYSPNIFLNQIENLLTVYNNEIKQRFERSTHTKKRIIGDLQKLLDKEKKEFSICSNFQQFSDLKQLQEKFNKILDTKKDLETLILEDSEDKLKETEPPSYSPVNSPPPVSIPVQEEDEYAVPKYEKDSDDSDDSDNSDDDSEQATKKQKVELTPATAAALPSVGGALELLEKLKQLK